MNMYELIQVGERTYYINSPSKIGVYRVNENEVYLIDSGNDKEAGKKIHKILNGQEWTLAGIINTHSNGDHIGGNQVLQQRTGCKVFSTELENIFIKYPYLEPSFLYGGYPFKELRNKFLMAQPSDPSGQIEHHLPAGLEIIRLGGHFFDMVGIKTSDDVYFLADALFGENIISKYHLSFIYDIDAYLQTLDQVEALEGKLYIPAHAEVTEDIKPLVQLNRDKVREIEHTIMDICSEPLIFKEILKNVFDHYNLVLDYNQYVLVGSTIRSYLSYLHDQGKVSLEIADNRLLWKSV